MFRGTWLFVTLFTAGLVNAQVWCPPGAIWTFNYSDMMNGWSGITRVAYEGDTLVGGFMAKKLRETNVIAPFGSTDYSTFTYPPSLLTREADGVVYVWGGWPQTFDTLMWFEATPGQHWLAPHMDDPFTRITVLDTSTVLVGPEPLRQLIVQFGGWEGSPPDTLHERIGFSLNYLNGWSWFITDQPWWGLRCYRDNGLSYSAPGVSDCGYTLSIVEEAKTSDPLPAPNPGTGHFALSVPPGMHTVTLFDATGRLALQQRISGEHGIVDTDHLPSGIYVVHVDEDARPVRWVKE